MKTRLRRWIVLGVGLWALLPLSARAAVAPTAEEMAQARKWMAARFDDVPAAKAVEPFFSFIYDGKPSVELLGTWKLTRATQKLDDRRTHHTLTYTDPKTRLELRCVGVEYSDYPTVEWTVYFKNRGDKDTPILSEIQALDIQVVRKSEEVADKGEFLLHHNQGSTAQPGDYGVRETVLGPGAEKVMTGAGGCPTPTDLSYFNLAKSPSEGMIVAVGWPGQLATRFTRDAKNGVRIRAGQELTHFKLLSGEEVRTPLVTLQFWKGGDWLRAQNVWRRWFIAHNLRKPGGKLPPAQWCGATLADKGVCMEYVTEENTRQCLAGYEALSLKPDFWWMDAGWYPCDGAWYRGTGTWEVDKRRFPRGIRAVTDLLHERGIRAILWFEPERVAPNTWLSKNHPEWILGGTLLDFGNPAAWKWIVARVDSLLVSENIDIYRQDFNHMNPLTIWRANDAPDRQGMTEMRHVTGLMAYWDELLRRHPNMLYDNCAGGGRRNDLESMRRGVPFTKSDYAHEPVGVQCETYGISMWLPYYAASWESSEDPYICRSNMAHVIGAVRPPTNPNYGKVLPKRLDEWRKTVAHYWGDFWPLTPYSLKNDVWMAWQFDRPEEGQGVVQAFRRQDCPQESITLKLRGLDPKARYELQNLDEKGSHEMTSKELLESGLPVSAKDRPSAIIILYKRISQQ